MTYRLASLLVLLALARPLAAQDALPLTVCTRFDDDAVPGIAVTAAYPGAAAQAAAATADDGCSALQLPVVTGVEAGDDVAPLALHLYPNPTAGGRLTVDVTGEAASVSLFDATGRRLATLLRQGAPPSASAHASLEHLPAGVYFVRLSGHAHDVTRAFVHLGGSLALHTRTARFSPGAPPPHPPSARTAPAKTAGYTIHLDLAAEGYAPLAVDTTFFTGDTLTFALEKIVVATLLNGSSRDPASYSSSFSSLPDSVQVILFNSQGDTLSSGFTTDRFVGNTPVENYFLSVVSPGNESFVRAFLKSGQSDVVSFARNTYGIDNLSEGSIVDDFFAVIRRTTPSHNNFVGGVTSGQISSFSAFDDSLNVVVFPVGSLLTGRDIGLGRDLINARGVINFYINQKRFDGRNVRFEPFINSAGELNDTLTFTYGAHIYPIDSGTVFKPPWSSQDSTTFLEFAYPLWKSIFENRLVDPFKAVLVWDEYFRPAFSTRNYFVSAQNPDLSATVGTSFNDEVVDGVRVLYSFANINGMRGTLLYFINSFTADGLKAISPGTELQGGLTHLYSTATGLTAVHLTAAGKVIITINGLFPSDFIISANPDPLNRVYGKQGLSGDGSGH